MRILVIGSTGMLGKCVMTEGKKIGLNVVGASRSMSDFNIDVRDEQALNYLFEKVRPDVVINAAAIVNLAFCEKNIFDAYMTNARSVSFLSCLCRKYQSYFIQISTDHYYTGDTRKKHKEEEEVILLNEYARTKYAGECFAAAYDNSLCIRTNIVGRRGKKGEPTFIEWLVDSLQSKRKITVFDDFYTSSMHTKQLVKVIFDFLLKRPTGIINVSSSDVFSKKVFIEKVATALGFHETEFIVGSVHSLAGVERGNSLGLDVNQVEQYLGYSMPNLKAVVECIVNDYGEILL